MSDPSEEDRLTWALQALGPDEFPTSYYRWLARKQLAEADGEETKA